MLEKLSIRNIVLIDRLDLAFDNGLCVLTGETGAGKSILLDSLALALGARADAGLVRAGAEQGIVTAEFSLPADHAVFDLLGEIEVERGEPLILRRTLGADGRSRASINDQPVSAALMRSVGEMLVEIHGQNAERGLLDARGHRLLLDQYGDLERDVAAVGRLYGEMQAANEALEARLREIEKARVDEEYLRHVVEELNDLAPVEGEEEALAIERSELMHAEKIAEALRDAEKALSDNGGVENRIRTATRAIERVIEKASGRLDSVLEGLERAAIEMAEAQLSINSVASDLDMDPAGLERIEERLFALRAAARKHKCDVAALPRLLEEFTARLRSLEEGSREISALRLRAEEAREMYAKAAMALGDRRRKTAAEMDAAVMKELGPLRLGSARFITEVVDLPEENWGPEGMNRVAFLVATNPGSNAGPLIKIASGGELSRFMLALKVVLAQAGSAPTLVFDEVDRGVGGATADAVGERLRGLAGKLQLLVITHSPQVAAAGEAHWNITKTETPDGAVTSVERLSPHARKEEIARMLSGASVTEEARAAARSLIKG